VTGRLAQDQLPPEDGAMIETEDGMTSASGCARCEATGDLLEFSAPREVVRPVDPAQPHSSPIRTTNGAFARRNTTT
jgi:hypothetical protein